MYIKPAIRPTGHANNNTIYNYLTPSCNLPTLGHIGVSVQVSLIRVRAHGFKCRRKASKLVVENASPMHKMCQGKAKITARMT